MNTSKTLSLFHAPLYKALINLYDSNPGSYHVPGHKYGQSLDMLKELDPDAFHIFKTIMALDVTELSVTDDLHSPAAVIAEAQNLAAMTFGAEQTFFLIGGSTAGNLAMILASCNPGDTIIVQRNIHKSVLNGLMLAQAKVVFLSPQTDPVSGLHIIPELSDVAEALTRYPETKAVFLSNPSYYGRSVDLHLYAELVHEHNCLLLVDEAHGAHYGQHPSFPVSALQAGADAVVQSTHKTLSALTMGAMLHVQGSSIDRDAVTSALTMIQSSSPSYPIMASLDIARAMIDVFGPSLFEKGIQSAQAFRQWVKQSSAWLEEPANTLNAQCDPLRVIVKDRTGRYTGYDLQQRLEKEGCWAEMADSSHVVLLFGMSNSKADYDKLIAAFMKIEEEEQPYNDYYFAVQSPDVVNMRKFLSYSACPISEPVLFSNRRMRRDQVEMIAATEAAGRIAAEAVIPYPPGIPILYPGELIRPDVLLFLKELARTGAKCQGVSDPTLQKLAVIRKD
ncbi:aminotransferase class I/II-fold pyridoxal phosphate-dependent enzyme [Paenibacillus nasutitermitis]|uniref:Aminotransferase class I/II-fold pyridoxal phosphate-dependent enzyme n=1 Tax=Paenibacillus nasutitermitis TaxID=1652958 RepID=A0A916ZI72_9BACL|nr:aminotransferase class I/II-fold pyridoxal phosphate-dependent enzyme [Paenibacillus nasutitermitis]GGD99320.1 hypothetical protein GCM10010911_67810 [Paenibacillus nasutitermitis]